MLPSTAWQCTSVEKGISPPTISTALKAYRVHKEFPVLCLVFNSVHSLQQPAWREHGLATGAKPRPHRSSAQCTASLEGWEGAPAYTSREKQDAATTMGNSQVTKPKATPPSLLTSWGFRYFPRLMTSVFIFMTTNTHPMENWDCSKYLNLTWRLLTWT